MTAGHLVADRELALGRKVDLHHLEHARGELVAALHVADLAGLLGDDRLNARPELAIQIFEEWTGIAPDEAVFQRAVAEALGE